MMGTCDPTVGVKAIDIVKESSIEGRSGMKARDSVAEEAG
jgi:hypothetical protein